MVSVTKNNDMFEAIPMGLDLFISHKRHIPREERKDDFVDIGDPLHIGASIVRKKEGGDGRKRGGIE